MSKEEVGAKRFIRGVNMVGVGVRFERIRRITGYLTGSLDTWNDAKRAEEKDRVKHCSVKSDNYSNKAVA